MHVAEDLLPVAGDQEAVRHDDGQAPGADGAQDGAPVGDGVADRLFAEEPAQAGEGQGVGGHNAVGGRPGGDADDVGGRLGEHLPVSA